MNAISYQFLETEFHYEVKDDTLIQVIRAADLKYQESYDLELLSVHHPRLLPVTLNWQDDGFELVTTLPQGQLFIQKKNWLTSEKIQLLLNLLPVQSLLQGDVRTFIHPNNLYLDYNGVPHFIYRGIKGQMPATDCDEEELLYQLKCLAGTLMTRHSFEDLYNGLLEESRQVSPFMKELMAIPSFAELKLFLINALQKAEAEEEKSIIRVPRRRFQLFKHLTIWLGIAVVVLGIPLGYLIFRQLPIQKACLEADTAFITNEYSKTISALDKVSLDQLPQTQRYELAYSYVHNDGFDAKQKNNIMKNITLKSDTRYLNFWIQEGRGDLEDATTTAKELEDSDLISYALLQQMDAVKADKSLKQDKKEEKLQQLQEEYQQIQEEKKGK